MRNFSFPIIIGITALILAATAAFFSVTGMGKIFIGWPILVMASAIELGKLVAVSILYRLWKELSFWKYLLIPMTLIIMLLTSAGIYGFLSSAYEETASDMRIQESTRALENNKKTAIDNKIISYQDAIDRKNKRSLLLSDLRGQQENRMDSLYGRNQIRTAKTVQSSIAQADAEISKLGRESDSLNTLIDQARLQISAVDSAMIVMDSQNSKGETGTLKYIARVSGWSMDVVANLFMLFIICVFDPLSILLVVAFNISLDKAMKKSKKEEESMQEMIGPEPPVQAIDEAEELSEPEPPVQDAEEVKELPETPPEETIEPDEAEELPEPVVYETNDSGDFVRSDEPVVEEVKKISPWEEYKRPTLTKKELFLKLLYIIYKNGILNENDNLDEYKKFAQNILDENIDCTEQQVEEFLTMCDNLKIIKIGKKQRVALKRYQDAAEVMDRALS
jgi:hypothetical protein